MNKIENTRASTATASAASATVRLEKNFTEPPFPGVAPVWYGPQRSESPRDPARGRTIEPVPSSEPFDQAAEAGIHRLAIPTPFAVGRVNVYLIDDEPLQRPYAWHVLYPLSGQLRRCRVTARARYRSMQVNTATVSQFR